jgi:hypothetical protein
MKTKSIITLLALISFCHLSMAQKADKKDATIETTLNFQTGNAPIGLTISEIRMRYFLKKELAVRTRLAFNFNQSTDYSYDGMNPTNPPFTINQQSNDFRFILGIEKHFEGTEKLSPYFGAEGGMGISSMSKEGTNTINGTTYFENGQMSLINSGAFSVYGGLVFGADYYFLPSIYLGAEIGYGFGYQDNGFAQYWNNNTNTTIEVVSGSRMGFTLQTNSGIRLGIKF